MKFSFLIAISFVACAALGQTPDEPSAELKGRIDQIDSITADFTQHIVDERGRVLEESSGRLFLEKPNFRWEVDDPFPQIIVARGSEVEIYDPDLEQLTQKTIGNSIEEAPLTLLTNPELDLALHFVVERLASPAAGSARFLLLPTSEESLFASLELEFVGDRLDSFIIVDHTGQQTFVRFAQFQTGQVIQSNLFELDTPPGTDVVRG